MNDLLIKIFGVAMLGALISVILRRQNGDMAQLLRAVVGIVLCIVCVLMLSPLVDSIRELAEQAELGSAAESCISVLLRALCIALLSHICASVCRDCGEATIAYYAELGGKVEILLLSLPLFRDVLELALDLVSLGG